MKEYRAYVSSFHLSSHCVNHKKKLKTSIHKTAKGYIDEWVRTGTYIHVLF